MTGTIYYEISYGDSPFTVTLTGNGVNITETKWTTGIYSFSGLDDGTYTITVASLIDCSVSFEAIVNCATTTSTTTICDVYAEIESMCDVEVPPTTTSTSTSSTTTTTTTNFSIVMCNTQFYAEGRQSYPEENIPTATVLVGNGLGDVICVFNTFNVPDRLMIEYDGNWIIDTGYVCDPPGSFYGYGDPYRDQFTVHLIGKTDHLSHLTYPIEGAQLASYIAGGYNVYPNVIEPDGFPRVNASTTTYLWEKLTYTSECKVYVFGPSSYTQWILMIGCPDNIYVTSTSTSSTTTSTTTIILDVNTLFVYYDTLD